MKKMLLFLLLSSFAGFANDAVLNSLCDVNTEWKNQADGQKLAASSAFNNQTFDDWIATHLMLVEQTLRQRPAGHLTIAQQQNRFRLLDELNDYWHARNFPVNDYLTFKNPVFIDRNNNYCAVGFLMKQSGAWALAHAIDADNKFVYVKNIKTKGVVAWAEQNGFTIEELSWIQPAYPAVFTVDGLDNGMNEKVNCLAIDPYTHILYAGGSFTTTDAGLPCPGVAAYINGIAGFDWITVGNGLNGPVHTFLFHNNKLYAGGSFSMSGTVPVSNVAVFDFLSSQWQAMGSLDSSVNSLVVFNNEIYAGGNFTELVAKWSGTQWVDVNGGWLIGEGVRAMKVWQNKLIVGGKFELPTGAMRKNVATYDGVQMSTLGFGTATPVNDFEIFHDTLYAGCDFYEGTDSCVLARFESTDWVTLVKPRNAVMDYLDGVAVRDLLETGGKMYAAGDFFVSTSMVYGNHLFEFVENGPGIFNCNPLMTGDAGLRTLAPFNNTLCFGGEITEAGGDTTINHVGLLTSITTNVNEPNKTVYSLNAFPNPSDGKITINVSEPFANLQIRIFDTNGREVYSEKLRQSLFTVDMSENYTAGVYMMQVVDDNGNSVANRKLVLY